jgi:hypothetical protein
MMHQLNSPAMLDPRWFNEIQNGITEGRAIDFCTVRVNGQILSLASPFEIRLVPDQKVFVSLRDSFYFETEQERTARLEKQARQIAEQQEIIRQALNNRRIAANHFNAQLHIPVEWLPGTKDVLSGLSENSMGNGYNVATVEHIWLQEDLHEGRLHRNKYDFLCTSASGSNGKQWSGQTESYAFDADNRRYQPQITCKACLKIAQRWNKRKSEVAG